MPESLHTEADLAAAVAHSNKVPVVLYKHSATCGVSYRARREIEHLIEATDPPVYEVVVQHARALSSLIAERWHIRHESPQVIVLHRGEPIFNASHRRVTAQALRDAIQHISPS